jgi:hypothetical protein
MVLIACRIGGMVDGQKKYNNVKIRRGREIDNCLYGKNARLTIIEGRKEAQYHVKWGKWIELAYNMANSMETIKTAIGKIEIPRAARAEGAKTWSNFAHAKSRGSPDLRSTYKFKGPLYDDYILGSYLCYQNLHLSPKLTTPQH